MDVIMMTTYLILMEVVMKVLNLSHEKETEIYGAIKKGALRKCYY